MYLFNSSFFCFYCYLASFALHIFLFLPLFFFWVCPHCFFSIYWNKNRREWMCAWSYQNLDEEDELIRVHICWRPDLRKLWSHPKASPYQYHEMRIYHGPNYGPCKSSARYWQQTPQNPRKFYALERVQPRNLQNDSFFVKNWNIEASNTDTVFEQEGVRNSENMVLWWHSWMVSSV